MGFRRSPGRIAAAGDWQHFVSANARVLAATRLPPAVTTSIENWDDFLMHGWRPGVFAKESVGWALRLCEGR